MGDRGVRGQEYSMDIGSTRSAGVMYSNPAETGEVDALVAGGGLADGVLREFEAARVEAMIA